MRYSYHRMTLPFLPVRPDLQPIDPRAAPKKPLPVIALLLPRRLQLQAHYALGRKADILIANNWKELERLVRKRPLRAVILDPALETLGETDRVVRLFTRYPSLPVIAYVTLDSASFNAIARLSRFGLEHVILHRHDDTIERFNSIVEEATADPLVRRVLSALKAPLERLPLALAIALEDLFEEPHRFPAAQDLTSDTGYSILQMYQSFKKEKLASPKTFLIAARTLRAYSYLRDPGYTVVDVAEKLGYSQPRVLSTHSSMVFGLTLTRTRKRISEEKAVKRVLRFVGAPERAVKRHSAKRKSSRG